MSGLVTGLQNQLHPFESGTHLTKKEYQFDTLFLFVDITIYYLLKLTSSAFSEQVLR